MQQIKNSYSKNLEVSGTVLVIIMAAVGFFLVLFSSSKTLSYIASISGLGAGIAHAETTDGTSDTDASDSSAGCAGPCDGDCDGG